MPTILLIRHAENDYVKKGRLACRLPGVHLNEAGRAQARSLAEGLSKAPIKAIYSSPMERAIETAEPLAQALGLEIIPCQGLIESDCGEWQGKSVKQLSRTKPWRGIQNRPSLFRLPGGESFTEIQYRFCQAIEQIRHQHAPEDLIACVSHADPIKLAIAYYIGLSLDHFQRLTVNPASVTTMQIDDAGSRLITLLNNYPTFSLPKP